ncbi:hypothetical protein [Microbacterium sp. K22]|uniref:hypothetical protein n=2 Tax=unclassified Microbacterium TaxID=2609290 RepID=UPI00109CCACD|nr:hypothetical protein [Microbacterium sp. K22]
MTLMVTATACSGAPAVKTGEAIGKRLSWVNDVASTDTEFLIQDSSPRVGEPASFNLSTSDPTEWIVVAICADDPHISSAGAAEISIIPRSAYTASVKVEVEEGEFRDAVTCEGLAHR